MGYELVYTTPLEFLTGVIMLRRTPPTESVSVARTLPLPAAPRPVQDAAEAERARLVALVGRMAARDEAALGAFYDATLSRAYGLALRITRNAALAEEVTVDAFHQAWREAARYDSARSRPLTWFLMICRSRALDALRSRDPAMSHEDPATLIADADQPRGDDPLDLMAAAANRDAVHSALGRLTPVQRQMIALAFFRGLTHQEISAHTRQPIGTVKSYIRRALDVLRRELAVLQGEQR
ncbi:MAG: sigma-70 family RNA polymerase sigma factor [Casimicrobiaceae bacterium]